MNEKETDLANANAETQKTPKEAYVSFGKKESATLRQLCLRSLRLYFELKWLADFKTGRVGTFGQQTLTYEGLARMVEIPVRQGMTASHGKVDGTEIKRLLERLEDAGLVANLSHDGTRLTMTLPMSPIKAATATKATKTTKKEAAKKAAPVSEPMPEPVEDQPYEPWCEPDWMPEKLPTVAEKLPTETRAELPANPHDDCDFEDFADAPSVLVANTYQYLSVHDSVRESPPPQGRQPIEGVDEAERTMGELEIELMLKEFESPPVLYMQTKETRQLIRNMEALGVERWEIDQAVEQVRKDPTLPLTPAAILRELQAGRIKRQQRRARGLGGRVAL
jgi:hypothetical protein